MTAPEHLLLFLLGERRHALPLDCVERVVQVVEITPLPGSPAIVLGVIDLHGQVVAVVEPRLRLGLPLPERQLSQQLVIARTPRRTVALLVDAVPGLIDYTPSDLTDLDAIVPDVGHVSGVVARADGVVLIHDLDRFLSLDDERRLDQALQHV